MAVVDTHVPPFYWSQLTQDDKDDFLKIRANFRQSQKVSSKDRRVITFRRELLVVLDYIERRPENMEARAILTGLCFAGPVICVNTRQLKSFLSRCKSSINGSFQQLGFVALRVKAKARECVVAVLPSLRTQQTILRQWTARYVSDNAKFCFYSVYPYENMPEVLPDDLFEQQGIGEETQTVKPVPFGFGLGQRTPLPLRPTILEFDLAPPTILEPVPVPVEEAKVDGAMKGSYSVCDFRPIEFEFTEPIEWGCGRPPMRKSGSVQVQSFGRTWNLFDDDDEDTVF
jgi:hypothetical protein